MIYAKLPTQAELLRIFEYDEISGDLVRKIAKGSRWGRAGETAGTKPSPKRYVRVNVASKQYSAHRLIWVMVHGDNAIPAGMVVDHVNGNKSDNRLSNLRVALPWQNTANAHSSRNPKTGARGVYRAKGRRSSPYCAEVRAGGRRVFCKYFPTVEEAAKARRQALSEHHGEFACEA